MGPELTDDNYDAFPENRTQVWTAWLLAVVVVTLLMTVVAPFLIA